MNGHPDIPCSASGVCDGTSNLPMLADTLRQEERLGLHRRHADERPGLISWHFSERPLG
jgi:hypothetical protein